MKFSIVTIIYFLAVCFSSAYSEEVKVYTEQGFPYKQLVERTDKVQLHFKQRGEDVDCYVSIDLDNNITKTKLMSVSAKRFKKAPFASCVSRSQAKKILALTFD